MTLTLSDLVEDSPITQLGGDRYALQGDTDTGKSTLAANIAASYGGPVLYLTLDPNVKYLGQHLTEGAQIDFVKISLKQDPSLADKREVMQQINFCWNSFLMREESPRFHAPYMGLVWDTHTRLWDFIGPYKAEERVSRSKNSTRDINRLDWGDSNEWMESLSTLHDEYRPDACMIFLLHEKFKFVQDDKGVWVASTTIIPDAWKNTKKHVQVYMRLYRRLNGLDRDGKAKKNARTGVIEKFSPDEAVPVRMGEIAEPEARDIVDLLEAYK